MWKGGWRPLVAALYRAFCPFRNSSAGPLNLPRTYLDHAATTPLHPAARAAVEEGLRLWANPSSPHAEGRAARRVLEDARERIKAVLEWDGEVIFTSGASEAAALALGRGVSQRRRFVSAVEHDAVFGAAPGAQVMPLAGGLPDFAGTQQAMVAVQHVNSETGTIVLTGGRQDDFPCILLADCAQSAGKLPLPDADMVIVSAHKFGGPVGTGALLVRDYALLEPSGGHERGYRRGTENLPGILGMAAALEAGGLDRWATTEAERWAFRDALGEVLAPGAQCSWIFAAVHPALGAQAVLIRLDAAGFAISAGSACSSGTLKPSRALAGFGVAPDVARRTVRISLGWNTTAEELERFVDAWQAFSR